MKTFLIIILILGTLTIRSGAQNNLDAKRDYLIFTGYEGTNYPGMHVCGLNFNSNPVSTFPFQHNFCIIGANSSMCDSSGNLLFITNGTGVFDRYGQTMPNGNSINYTKAGYSLLGFDPTNHGYLMNPTAGLSLPYPGKNNLFVYVQSCILSYSPIIFSPIYTIINMDVNNGLGDVVLKNEFLLRDTTCYPISANRHANGRDWWIMSRKAYTGTFYIILLSPEGFTINTQWLQLPASDTLKANAGKSFFSQDGSKYYELFDTINNLENIRKLASFDFDRATGKLSNYSQIILDDSISINHQLVCNLSPNGRFLYVAKHYLLQQFDLWATNVAASQIKLDSCSYTIPYPGGGYPGHGNSVLGPDGKIYISSDSKCLHVIHNPDNPGTLCNFEKCAIITPYRQSYLPNLPNFRLGAAVGMQELPGEIGKIMVFPNPAKNQVTFDINIRNNNQAMSFHIINATGTIVHEEYFAPFQSVVNYNVIDLPSGIYQVVVSDNSLVWASGRFAVVN